MGIMMNTTILYMMSFVLEMILQLKYLKAVFQNQFHLTPQFILKIDFHLMQKKYLRKILF